MDPARASLTAIGTALMRAEHTRHAREPLIDDPWGDHLITDGERERLGNMLLDGLPPEDRDALEAVEPDELIARLLRSHPSYGTVIIRTRYTEDALADAVARGVRQFVIIGAGMDSFALRRPAFASDLQVFEVDHPATQELKLRRLASSGVEAQRGVHYVSADLGVDSIDDVLGRSPFHAGQPSFFSWLGVTVYLTREANLNTLQAIAASGAPDSEVVFDFRDQRTDDSEPPDEGAARVLAQFARASEPWISGFDPAELGDELLAVGLALIEDLSPADLRSRYCNARDDGMSPAPKHHLARARVAA